MSDIHALALLRAYTYARESVIWIALLLLIKCHTDLQSQVNELALAQVNMQGTTNSNADGNKKMAYPSITWPSDGLGDLTVQGDLTVRGCVLWQQEIGLFQNSCTVFASVIQKCVHGLPSGLVSNPQHSKGDCICEMHWQGPNCDIHDCYGRGIFELNTGLCECRVEGYVSSSMCRDKLDADMDCKLDFPIPFGEKNCYGQCVNGQCICTLPGQIGIRCMQCAYPAIDAENCPGRSNWGVEYIDTDDQFGVCGGGYEFLSASIVVLRGLNCQSPTCRDFRSQRSRCCNPLALANFSNCPGWLNWTYNRADFGSNSVFNDQSRLRYLQILVDHDCTSDDCLRRSYTAVQTSDWPMLGLDHRPMRGFVIYLNDLSLGLAFSDGTAKLVASQWLQSNTTVYLTGSGVYIDSQQLYFLVEYNYPQVFCLSDQDASKWDLLVLSNSIPGRQIFWQNLLDQPGIFLPMQDYCGLFQINRRDGKFRRRFGGVDNSVFPGSRVGGGYWWPLDQGTALV